MLSFINLVCNKQKMRLLFSSINLYLFVLLRLGGGGVLAIKNIQAGSFYISYRHRYVLLMGGYIASVGAAFPFLVEGAGVSNKSLYTGFYSFAFLFNAERITLVTSLQRSDKIIAYALSPIFQAASWVERE